ncbi:MAG TPA: nucleoside triphosphate pyrophosphohydrolase, partial [Idiomarina loihiensis]|nr:nucleoside triphosphate pyrophosphohydrolase [Idiomarina loihiensis]
MKGMQQLQQVMTQLRNPESGCPWDLKQNMTSLIPYTIEETYEVVDAIQSGNWQSIKDELG